MSKKYILVYLFALAFINFSCTGVQNMSGSLTKSGDRTASTNEYTKHGDYSKSAGYARRDSLAGYNSSSQSANKKYEPATGSKNTDVYKKDYGKLVDTKPENSDFSGNSPGNSVQDYNQKLVSQYAEMDKVGDLVLYELDIIERRYTLLLGQFKTANNADRESISGELDKLSADQLMLYKSYTKIYKSGKTDWPRVKNEVETTLMNLRGVDRK